MSEESQFPEFPDLPPEFLKWLKTTGRQVKEIPKDLAEAFNEWQREKEKSAEPAAPGPGRPTLKFEPGIIQTRQGRRKEMSEVVSSEDREFVRSELARLAEFLKKKYGSMTFHKIRRYLREMLDVSV